MGNFSLKNTCADKKYPYFVIDIDISLWGCADTLKTTNQPTKKSVIGKALAVAAGGGRSPNTCPYALPNVHIPKVLSGGALWTA